MTSSPLSSSSSVMLGSKIMDLGAPYKALNAYHYDENEVTIRVKSSIRINGFAGFSESVSLYCSRPEGTITCDVPGCIASPIISMIAQKSIMLGTHQMPFCKKDEKPLSLYAPGCLTIQTKHLVIGDIEILDEPPLIGKITCDRLTVIATSPGVVPKYFELVTSWLNNSTQTKIELLQPTAGFPGTLVDQHLSHPLIE